MVIPLFAFFVGVLLLSFNYFLRRNQLRHLPINKFINPQFENYFIFGNSLCAIALMLGMVGYFSTFSGSLIRVIRLILIMIGFFYYLISTKIVSKQFPDLIQQFQPRKYSEKIVINILNIISISVLISLFLTAFFDATYGGDGFWYHLPFAGRIWGLIPPETYSFEEILEYRYLGLPLLGNFFQGLFWFIFQRAETANLFCYFSLIIFIAYLKFYLKIPFYLATISLLAVPMIHMHSTKMYIDLPSNIFASITILTIYIITINNFNFNKYELGILFFSALLAANIKYQMTPIIFVMVAVFLGGCLIKINRNQQNNIKEKLTKTIKSTILISLANIVIFFTCTKNIIIYQNPFYPMKLDVGGIVLNHTEVADDVMHDDLRKYHKTIRWSRSLLEIGAFDERRPWRWSLGMDFIDRSEKTLGVVGYFGGYVVFNLLFLTYISWRFWGKEIKYALLLFLPISLFTAYLPQSYELRYYMYWMIVLVSLNAYLCSYFSRKSSTKIVKPIYFALVATVFMLIFMHTTRYWFTKPQFSGFNQQLQRTDIIDQQLLTNIKNGKYGENICLIGKTQFGLLYSSYFHPENSYSITAEFNLPEKIERRCHNKTIIP